MAEPHVRHPNGQRFGSAGQADPGGIYRGASGVGTGRLQNEATADSAWVIVNFNEEITDSSGNSNTLTVDNWASPTYINGWNPSNATDLAGRRGIADDNGRIHVAYNDPDEFTVEFVFKHNGNPGAQQLLASCSASANPRPWQIAWQTDGTIQTASNVGSPYTINSGGSYGDDAWHHVIWAVDWGTNEKLYVDGVEIADVTPTSSKVTRAQQTIGSNSSDQKVFRGDYAFYAQYDTQLSVARINAHMNASGIT